MIEFVVKTLMTNRAIVRSTGRLEEMVEIINRFIRHLMVGGIGMLFYMVNLTILVEIFKQNAVLSSIVAFIFLTLYTYLMSRFWVYQVTQGHGYSFPRFIVVTLIAFLLNTGVMYFSVEIFKWWYIWGQVGAALIVPPTNFLLNYYWAFK